MSRLEKGILPQDVYKGIKPFDAGEEGSELPQWLIDSVKRRGKESIPESFDIHSIPEYIESMQEIEIEEKVVWTTSMQVREVSESLMRRVSEKLVKYVGVLEIVAMLLSKPVAKEEFVPPPPTIEAEITSERRVDVAVEGLDAYATPERMKALLYETLPTGWADHVGHIHYEDVERVLNHAQYGIAETVDSTTLAVASGGSGHELTNIYLYQSLKNYSRSESLGGTLLHEMGHAVDWRTNADLSESERAELMVDTVERVQSEDRFRSSYVESIKSGVEMQAIEYWAEVVMTYLQAPDPAHALNEQDIELVERYIKKTDPEFDQHEALMRRYQIFREMSAADLLQEIDDALLVSSELSDAEKEEIKSWMSVVIEHGTGSTRSDLQRQGRKAFATRIKHWATTDEKRDFAAQLLSVFDTRKVFLDNLSTVSLPVDDSLKFIQNIDKKKII